MGVPVGKEIRSSYLLAEDQRFTLIVDFSRAGSAGPLPGLELLRPVLEKASPLCHAVILNRGAVEKNADLLGGKASAVGLVRADWTNAFRPEDFALPVQRVHRVRLSDAEDAVALGAAGIVAMLLMGYDDEFEAENIEDLSRLARACYRQSLPLLVDIWPIGPKVTRVNHDGVVELAVSFAMEAGADVLIVPEVGDEARALLGSWPTVPVLERRDAIPGADDVEHLASIGYRGVVLTERVLVEEDWPDRLASLFELCRAGKEGGA